LKKVGQIRKSDGPHSINGGVQILLVMIDQRPELQRMPAASVEDIVAPGEDILPEVRRSDIWSQLLHTTDIEGSDLLARHKRVLRADNPGRRRIVRMGPAKGHPERAEERRGKNVIFGKCRKTAPAVALGTKLWKLQRVGFGRVAKREPAKHAIGGRKIMIHSALRIVVLDRLSKGKREPVIGKIRVRIEGQKWRGYRRNAHGRYRPQLRAGRIRDHRARRSVTPSGDRVTNGRDAKALPQSFIDSKEKCLILLDRPSDGAPKLITHKGGQPAIAGGSFVIEEVAGIERTVSEVFEKRTVQRVRPALGDHHHLASHGHAVF